MSIIVAVIISIIIGALVGLAIGIGTARMFHAPEKQALGAFRTLGEINACNGDPVSHFAFGLGFFFNSTASAIGTGALTQDVIHRIIPNWGIGLAKICTRKKDVFQVMRSPLMVGLGSMVVGIIVMPLMITIYNYIPKQLSSIASGILTPAANYLFNYIMPVLFLIAALDAGKKIGLPAILFGVLSQFISGNAIPGIVLGILVGSSWDQKGLLSLQFWLLLILALVLFVLIAYFRKITWDDIIHLKNVKALAYRMSTDFQMVSHLNVDYNILLHPGIIQEVL
ncbi:DUF4311 domain-containing protein [Spiroplasma sp. SV19]|uniref:DUF4311 domain-containing protein n=1 Tax=Spiroplasma sp. SV19 TaxID=2570468 RepID=UPI0024B7ECA7|nr:DUF4311 domain-containing protein [Spiroplasma sp. SV19]